MPLGPIPPIGCLTLDIGTDWFRHLVLRGHRFLNWYDGLNHAPFSQNGNGRLSDLDTSEYARAEERAQRYLEAEFPEVADRLIAAFQACPPEA